MFGFGAAASTAPDHQQALDEVVPAVLGQVGERPDLVVCFFSMEHAEAAAGISLGLSERTGTAAIIGCTAGGVIGGRHELEDSPALSLWAARLPGVRVTPFALDLIELVDGYGVTGWPDLDPAQRSDVLLLPDPFSFPADSFVRRLNEDQPGIRLIGGMASGANGPCADRLLLGPGALAAGAVVMAISGRVASATGGAPMTGLFSQRQLGPVGGQNFLHGFTASVALFREPTRSAPSADQAAEPAEESRPPAPA